jgi:hypothetical protein
MKMPYNLFLTAQPDRAHAPKERSKFLPVYPRLKIRLYCFFLEGGIIWITDEGPAGIFTVGPVGVEEASKDVLWHIQKRELR